MGFLGLTGAEVLIAIGILLMAVAVLGVLYMVIRHAVAEGTRRGRTTTEPVEKASGPRE